jgi:hypothetical protein
MPIRVPLQFAKPTMRLAKPICDTEGRLVAGTGTLLTDHVLRTLRKMAIQTVLVADEDTVASWERTKPLAEELLDLERRLDREPDSEPLSALRAAITRHLCKRAMRLDQEPGFAPSDFPGPATPGRSRH